VKPLVASLLMAVVVRQTGLILPVDFGAILRLCVLVPVGAATFIGAIFLLDRKLVKDFLVFVQAAFERQGKNAETS
jgi:hypothetical protein